MSDDFAAAENAMSALSASPVLESAEASASGEGFQAYPAAFSQGDEDYAEAASPLAPHHLEAQQISEVLLHQSAVSAHPFRDVVTIHLCRGVGDERYIAPLAFALQEAGWNVVSSAIDPAGANSARPRILMGLGLGGTLALRRAADGTLAPCDGVVAICPFLGFDAPMYPNAGPRVISFKERAFRWASKRWLRAVVSRIECLDAYTGLGHFGAEPISWTDLVEAAASPCFADLLQGLSCPTMVVFDEDDRELDRERGLLQVPAMNTLAGGQARSLAGEGLLHAVEHALYGLFKIQSAMPHQEPNTQPSTSEGQGR